jgi:hypothetical protein
MRWRVRSFTGAGALYAPKACSFEIRTRSSIRAWAISMRAKGCDATRARRPHRSVTNRNRQAQETLALDHPGEVAHDWARCGELAKPMLCRNLPDGGSDNEDLIQLLADGFARVRAQTSSPASHKINAWVSKRSRFTSFPLRQLGVRHWLARNFGSTLSTPLNAPNLCLAGWARAVRLESCRER